MTGAASTFDEIAAPAAAAEHERLHYLDGLRGWAALAVVVYHATWELFKFYVPAVRTSWPGLANDGKLAVYIFFVLSGMVLSHPYLSTRRMEIVRLTALRRYTRLTIPIVAASFVMLVMMKAGLLHNVEASAIVRGETWLGSFYTQPPGMFSWLKFSLYDVFFRYDGATSYDMVLWTMPIELLGSFVVLGILALSGTSRRTRLFFYALIGFLCLRERSAVLSFVYGLLLAEMAVSPAFRQFCGRRWAGALGLLAIVIVFACSVMLREIYSARLCSFLAALLVFGILLNRPARRLLALPVSQFLGRISFPLYLIHSAVLFGPSSWLIVNMAQQGWSRPLIVAVVASFTVAGALIAASLFYPVERFAIALSRRLSRIVTDDSGRPWPFQARLPLGKHARVN